ncbi:MAG: hypothetical protein ACR2IT_02340 [Pirellulales bacterium]
MPHEACRCPSAGVRGLSSVVAVAVIFIAGCQRIVEVTGTVLVDGKPGKGLVVIFDPAMKDSPRGVAATGGDGAYKLRRLGPGNKTGVPTGTYSVKIMADVDAPNALRIPDRYARGAELTYDVQGGKPNVYDIQISTKE